MIFTSDVEPRHLEQFDRVRQGPCFLQGKIRKRVDLRIVVADSTLLCVEIASQEHPDSRTDYRRRVRWLRHSACTLPAEVAGAIRRLLSAFRLRFAVVDMAITPAGEYVFFELNANGQWLWLEDATGLPIAGAIADALTAAPDAETEEGRDRNGV